MSYGGFLGVGAQRGLFAKGSVGITDHEGLSPHAAEFGVTAGYAADIGKAKRVQVCPLLSVGFHAFPAFTDETTTPEFSGRGFSLGGSIGFVAVQSGSLLVLPALQGSLAHSMVTVTATDGLGGTFEDSQSDTHGTLVGGIGLVFNRAVTVQPFFITPIGVKGADASFGVSVSGSFGGRR